MYHFLHTWKSRLLAFILPFAMLLTAVVPDTVIYAEEAGGENPTAEEEREDTKAIDYSRIDVWDFGAEQLDEAVYTNKLTADTINSFYPSSVSAGAIGITIAGFSTADGELLFNDGGKTSTHRLRSTNTALTRYDNKSLKSEDGTVTYTGYLYSNSGSNTKVYLGIKLYKNDILTVCAASNGGNSTIHCEAPSGVAAEQVYTYTSGVAKQFTFYASEEGMYKIYSSDEKLVVARLYREHSKMINVSGTVTAPAVLTGYGLVFTNRQTGEAITAPVSNGTYSVALSEKYVYDVTLSNAKGYVIAGTNILSFPTGEENQVFHTTVSSVDRVKVTGKITGLPADRLSALTLKFRSDKVYIPEIAVAADGTYTLQLESNIMYTIEAGGVNDYALQTNSMKVSADTTIDLEFKEKTKYPVTINSTGISDEVKNIAEITFNNINEPGYSYTFPLNSKEIALRDGQYKITVRGTGAFALAMDSVPNIIIAGAAGVLPVHFNTIKDWNFAVYNSAFSGPGIETINGQNYYLGLKLSSTGVAENKTYLLLDSGAAIDIPVKAGEVVTVNYCYSAAFQFDGDASTKVDYKSGSTTQIESASCTAADDGYVTISGITGTSGSQTYLTGIRVTEQAGYKDIITVGASGCDYTTIGAALNAVKAMNRPNNERVTIAVQPGNYEEMLVIDAANVTIKNASANPSTSLTGKGVGIDPQAVRITSYYGHGYNYYSMGADSKYNAGTLAVNKANGYPSNTNPGAGVTNGSFWNATVVISAGGFSAEGIIFENSFNQYISEKEAKDIVVEAAGSKGARPKTAGDTSVQDKAYVERAAALAITDNVKEAYFDNCRFVGRQDTLYGGTGTVAAFHKCAVMGACDYIFGPMTAVFYKCKLVMNTSDSASDAAYLTAAQQKDGRGYLMYNCTVTSAVPGADTASAKNSKPGYFGRPWLANSSEVVFYKTIISATDYSGKLQSMIEPAGWLSTLSGESAKMYEYGTQECLEGTNHSADRVSWSTVLTAPKLSDSTDLSTTEKAIAAFLGSWHPFAPDAADDTAEVVKPTPGTGERAWYFSAFGQGVDSTTNYYTGSAAVGSVTIASENGKGKLVPASTDGLAFYYTTIDADKENFILSASVSVDSWKFSNGQEGFGLMAADAVGVNGDSSVFWNNSFMTSVTKVEYFWDKANNKVSDNGDRITMKLGIGAQSKTGVTAGNIADGTIVTDITNLFHSTMTPLETSCAAKGTGTYNLVGNYANDSAPSGTITSPLTTFRLTLQRDNTGYRLSYTDPAGKTVTKLYYDTARNALTQIDKDSIYVGFFASRNAKITVKDIKLTTSDPAADSPSEEEKVTYVTPSYRIISPTTSGTTNYELVFTANADGKLTIKDRNNNAITSEQAVTANTYIKKKVNLVYGNNNYTIWFTPNKDYKPGKNQLLSTYDTANFGFNVVYGTYSRNELYVSPYGSSYGTGSKNNPVDIYTAVKYARPGQKIILTGGTYKLTSTIVIPRGTNGTSDNMIYLIAEPHSSTHPVFDFGKVCAGMILAGDYWYLQGFDVTNSSDAQKGIQLSGDHCVLDNVNAYYNGNTGIQISRYLETDSYEDWPAYNLILNCTAFGNADKGYEDADGFAAKLTIGEGNIFDGCISYNNADDGWDLFAKVETGAIGQVIIRNCVAYGNGFLPNGTNAGNGNGFKLGGSSITGHHKLINCISYSNKAKGIDSNSCPDIIVTNCTSFNNGSYNVALYTTDAANTDFQADGILSFRTGNSTVSDELKPKGTQDTAKIYKKTNYYWDGAGNSSRNSNNNTAAQNWFVSLNTGIRLSRYANGTINMNGLLALTNQAPADTGARMTGTASAKIAVSGSAYDNTPTATPTPTPTPTPVIKQPEKYVPDEKTLSDITVNGNPRTKKAETKLYVGGTTGNTLQLKIVIPDSLQKAVDKGLIRFRIEYLAGDNSIASVTSSGLITAKKAGSAYVTVKFTVGDKIIKFRVKIIVKKAYIEFTKTVRKIKAGKQATFKINYYGLKKEDIIWSTSKKGIATVGKNKGKTTAAVFGTSPGTDIICIKAKGKGRTVIITKYKITVTE